MEIIQTPNRTFRVKPQTPKRKFRVVKSHRKHYKLEFSWHYCPYVWDKIVELSKIAENRDKKNLVLDHIKKSIEVKNPLKIIVLNRYRYYNNNDNFLILQWKYFNSDNGELHDYYSGRYDGSGSLRQLKKLFKIQQQRSIGYL